MSRGKDSHRWTLEEEEYLRKRHLTESWVELTVGLNAKFKLKLRYSQVRNKIQNTFGTLPKKEYKKRMKVALTKARNNSNRFNAETVKRRLSRDMSIIERYFPEEKKNIIKSLLKSNR